MPGVWLSYGHTLCKQLSEGASKVNCPLRDHHHAPKSRCVAKSVFPQSDCIATFQRAEDLLNSWMSSWDANYPNAKKIMFWGHFSTNMKMKNICKFTDQKITATYGLKLWWFGVEWKQPISFLSLFALGANQKFSEELIHKEELTLSLGLGRYNAVLPPFCISLLNCPYQQLHSWRLQVIDASYRFPYYAAEETTKAESVLSFTLVTHFTEIYHQILWG